MVSYLSLKGLTKLYAIFELGSIPKLMYEGQSIITEHYLITFKSSKIDVYLNAISLQLYVIYL